uniref:Kinesin motor domain-containing protein n=1 Tax=Odontella aurita TaxID=265563 RepID=A0A7S4K938_9STRA|mmetsp:Transcript_7227/g.21442  ORF Transcript_7227/g.21442 Transcript_7227/m.21442 type:complete len:1272 (+) Transcript_7227:343-4158(+)
MAGSSKIGSSSIQVAVRLRPMNEKEKKHGTLPVVTASTADKSVTVIKGQGARQARSHFNFDHVFTSFSAQEEVFEQTLKPVIGDVLKGYESTVFAYGQTGTGKTHTMEGDLSDPDMHGVIPRSAQSIFETLRKPQYSDHSITCSYLEIYNEELCDLLADEKQHVSERRSAQGCTKLEIMVGKNGTFCRGLSEVPVNCAEDVLALMHKAQHQRKVGETKMNKASSRSHSIFTMNIKAKALLLSDGRSSTMEFNGKLHMVDLAGSECAKTAGLDKATGTEATRERERMNINRSLLTLGRVISMLKKQSENKKSSGSVRIPYRDSKLTRILQESLGGRCKTVIIATLSPSVTAIEESISTLNYAQSANGIVNKPVSTSYMSIGPSTVVNSASSSNDIPGGDQGNSVEHWHQMECRLQYMQAQVEEAQAALARKHMQQQEFVERAEKAEEASRELEKKNYEATMRMNELKGELTTETTKRVAVESELWDSQIALKKTSAILCATQRTEANLTAEAKVLLQTLKESLSEGDGLFKVIIDEHESEKKRRHATRNFHASSLSILQETISTLSTLSKEGEQYEGIITKSARDAHERDHSSLANTEKIIEEVTNNIQSLTEAMRKQIVDEGGIVKLLDSTKSSVGSGVERLLKLIAESEDCLEASCGSARAQLTEQSEHVQKLSALHSAISSETVSNVHSNMSSTRARIEGIIGNAASALQVARDERAERMSAHSTLLEEWKEESLRSVGQIEGDAKGRRESLAQSIEVFSQESRHHDILHKTLTDQRSFLNERGTTHLEAIGEQNIALSKQSDMLAVARQSQQQLREEVVQNIMSGVKDLVHKQISMVLADEEQKHMTVLATSNSVLVDKNKDLQQSAKLITDTVEKSNISLREQAQIIRTSDEHAKRAMDDTTETLGQVITASEAHQQVVSTFSTKAEKGIAHISSLDNRANGMLEDIKKGGEGCMAHICDVVHTQTKRDIKRLTSAGHDLSSHSTGTIIPESLAAWEATVEPRKRFANGLQSGASQIRDNVLSGCMKVECVAKKQCELVLDLRKDAKSKEGELKKTIGASRVELDSRRDTVIEHAKMHSKTERSMLVDSSSKASNLQQQIKTFVCEVIHAEDAVSHLPERNVFKYSEAFSSTPSSEEIVKALDLSVVDKIPKVEVQDAHLSSRDSHDGLDRDSRSSSDTISVKSFGSTTSAATPVSHDENADPQLAVNTALPSSRKAMSTTKARRPLSRSRPLSTPSIGSMRKRAKISTGTPQGTGSVRRVRRNTKG